MSSSEDATASLRLHASATFDELTVVDGRFRPVATGIGALATVLRPGIYEIVARAGPTIARRLIKLAAGEVREELAPAVPFPSTAPIGGSASEDEGHLALVRAVTASVAELAGPDGAICVVVRDMTANRRPIVDNGQLALMDEALHDVIGFGSEWRLSDDGSAAAWAALAKPGGYALRLGLRPDAVDLALWLPAGWTLVVFLAIDGRGIHAGSVTVHLVPKGQAWLGEDEAVATELALWGLREGRSQAAEVAVRAIADGTVSPNPLLQMAAAHLILEASPNDERQVASIIDRLATWAPDHPDVIALQMAAAERGVGLERAPHVPVGWPPMLLESYRALLRRDAVSADVFAPGAVAERAAGSITAGTIWSTWRPVASAGQIPPRLARTKVEPDRVLAKAARNPGKLRRPKYSDPATRRVAAYLNAVADLDDGDYRTRVAHLSPAQIALATGLPTATVDVSLRRIWLTIAGFSVFPFIVTLSALVGALAVAFVGVALFSMGGAPFPSTTAGASPSSIPSLLPRIEIQSIELPASPLGAQSAVELPIPNVGDAPLTILDLATAGEAAGEFGYEEGNCRRGAIASGDQCVVVVTFTPRAVGERTAELRVTTQEIGVVTIGLRGTGIAPLRFEPTELVLAPGQGADVLMTATVTVRIESIEIAGDDPKSFVLQTSCRDRVLEPADNCAMFVQYESGDGADAARIEVVIGDGSTWVVPINAR